MSRILIILFSAAALFAVGAVAGWHLQSRNQNAPTAKDAPGPQPAYRSGAFQVGVRLQPQTPKVGENRFELVLNDAGGAPVAGANVRAVAEMPAMGSMPAMQAPADLRETAPGRYTGRFEIPMDGSWPLTLDIAQPKLGKTRITLDMATGRAGLQLASGGVALAAHESNTANAGSAEPAFRSGPYRFDVTVEPKTPQVGSNTLTLRLTDANGKPVRSAQIGAVAEMPAMGTMPAMRAPATMKEVEAGVYRGSFELAMDGSWPLSLAIQAPGKPQRHISFDLATGRDGLQLASGAISAGGGADASAQEAPPGTVTLDSRRRQLIGVTTATAEIAPLVRSIRAVGKVTYDERRLSDVSLKFNAWVGKLYVDYLGAHVLEGQPLFTVYGPDLLAAQQEYLDLKRRGSRVGVSRTLLAAARKRLTLWDMSSKQIAALEQRGEPFDYVPIHAPRTGTVVKKNIVEGTARKAGMTLIRIADLSRVWVEAQVYESELPLIQPGMTAKVTLPYLPGHTLVGKVSYVYPYLDDASRTARVRIALDNADGALKPDMYAEVQLEAVLGDRLTVPAQAVIVSGDTRVVFEDLGSGRLAPRVVKTGQHAQGHIEIISGLKAGVKIVTSGNFLIASESRLKSGLDQW